MFEILLSIFCLIGIGWIAGQLKLLKDNTALNDYVYYIALPALILSKVAVASFGLSQVTLLIANLMPMLVIMGLVLLFWHKKLLDTKLASALMICSFFGNIVYMGLPIIQDKLGTAALPDAILIATLYNVVIFTIGIAIVLAMNGKANDTFVKDKLLKNAIIASCVIGVVLSISGLGMPSSVESFLVLIGATTTVVALVSMGVFMQKHWEVSHLMDSLMISGFKLMVFPILVATSMGLFSITGIAASTSVLLAIMPLAVTNFVIAQKFDLDAEVVAQSVVLGTILAIPLLLGL